MDEARFISSSDSSLEEERPENNMTINDLYLDVKTDMLEVVHQGLKLRWDIASIKEQFLDLLKNYEMYKNRMTPDTGLCPKSKVKAIYSGRRARLQQRRAAVEKCELAAENVGNCEEFNTTLTPRRGKRMRRDSWDILQEVNNNTPSRKGSRVQSVVTSTPAAGTEEKFTSNPLSSVKKLFRSSREARNRRKFKEENKENIGARRRKECLSDGEYVSLRVPKIIDIAGEYVTLAQPDLHKKHNHADLLLMCRASNETSIWEDTFAHAKRSDFVSPPSTASSSPIRYAKSDKINKLYTDKCLKDVSVITTVSKSTLREQRSSDNISVDLPSPLCNHPLHSTLNYPLHSTLNMEELSPSEDNISSIQASISAPVTGANTPVSECDRRTFMSDPDQYGSNNVTTAEPGALCAEMSNMIINSHVSFPNAIPDSSNSSLMSADISFHTPEKIPAESSTRETTESPSSQDYFTPPNKFSKPKLQNILCKEHGLHPTFGGPCIFADDKDDSNDRISDSSESQEEESSEYEPRTDTDCDSSYLSECMDDVNTFPDCEDKVQEYTATYDTRHARMKMLKRQTGQFNIKKPKAPVGLSESDILNASSYSTKKHLSLVATRASLPDLSAFSASPSDEENNQQQENESTLTPSTLRETDISRENSLNKTLMLDSDKQRPLSIKTTNTTECSPDSNGGGPPPPVNSPNVTDSGGSSSRPTTDNYDYIELPVPRAAKIENCGRKVRTRSNSGHSHDCSDQSDCDCNYYSNRIKRYHSSCHDFRSHGSHVPQTRYSTLQSNQRKVRRTLNYRDDSGFSTHSSHRPVSRGGRSCHFEFVDNTGVKRTVVQHSPVAAKNLQKDRKKVLVKKMKKFNNNFYKIPNTGNLNIETLGHF